MKKFFFYSVVTVCLFAALPTQAKIWRVNNNAGVTADFTTFNAAANSASVFAGDTIHLEPSASNYVTGSINLSKRLVVIGVGYFLDPANVTTPGNAGLQVTTQNSKMDFFRIGNGANGSKFIGLYFTSGPYLGTSATAFNIVFEKCLFESFPSYFENAGTYDAITIRKCFFNGATISASASAVLTNVIIENNIFYGGSSINLPQLSGTGNIIRNNSFINGSAGAVISNSYVANNIFSGSSQGTFTNCTIKNNLFQANQTLPPTATGNQVNVIMTNVYVGGTTGSLDSRAVLKAGPPTNPAIGTGLTVGSVINPDCGAFGATDPYKLSGIPNIPSIYTLTVPTSIPSGSTNMSVTFSTRNNN